MSAAAVEAPLARARKLAAASAAIAVIAAILVGASAIAQVAAPLTRLMAEPGASALAFINTFGAHLVLALPAFIIAGVCLDLRCVMLDYAGGRIFTRRASAGVRKTGEGVLWAMAFKCVLSPWLYAIIMEGLRGGPPPVQFDAFDLGLIALGFFILVMGRVLEAAAAIKAENDQIV